MSQRSPLRIGVPENSQGEPEGLTYISDEDLETAEQAEYVVTSFGIYDPESEEGQVAAPTYRSRDHRRQAEEQGP